MKKNLTLALLLTPLIFFGMNTQAKEEEALKTEKTCMVKTVDGGERKCTKKQKKEHKKKKHDKKKHHKKEHKKHQHKNTTKSTSIKNMKKLNNTSY